MRDVEGKLNEWIRLFKSTLKGHQTLFIIDDCLAEDEINKKSKRCFLCLRGFLGEGEMC